MDLRLFDVVLLLPGVYCAPFHCHLVTLLQMHGFGFHDLFLVFDKWQDGYKGHSIEELTALVSTGQCI